MIAVLMVSPYRTVNAAEGIRIMAAHTIEDPEGDGDHVKIFVRNAPGTEAEYQIGMSKVENVPDVHGLGEDNYGMRTLIMLDNSMSIPKNSRPLIIDGLNAIVDAHADNEQFRIATFSTDIAYMSDRFSDDYTALHSMIETISFNDQDTKLTDVLDHVIDSLNSDSADYEGYTRIVIITDGVNDKEAGGVSLDRIIQRLGETPYPIYTIGCDTGKNDDLLDNLFRLSWETGCEHIVLENSEISDITALTSADNSITVFDYEIPDEVKNGSRQSSQLTFSDGTAVKFDIDVPFGEEIKPTPEPAPVTPTPEPETPEPDPVQTDDGASNKLTLRDKIVIGAGSGIVAAGLATLIIILVRSKKRKRTVTATVVPPEEGPTVVLNGNGGSETDTVQLTPGGSDNNLKRYIFSMTDKNDPSRIFKCELSGEISIGRKTGNSIVITDDDSVHRKHCVVKVRNGVFYITDDKDVKNHTAVNGIPLKPEIPQLIVNNSVVTIGRRQYGIEIKEV